ncbi:insulinase family protein [Candidatus Woesebacteria bacterium]|nr:insulinase family protein [Candidatus Woesebacteria bacterium]
MDYKLKSLSNGLGVLSVEIPSYESVTVTVWVKTGSRYEDQKVNGISHFLEHMVFKGSKKRPGSTQISEAVDAIGAEFNAATSKDWTNFYIKSRKENLDFATDVLSDMVLNPILDEQEITKEKGVIIQEIGMIEDNPMHKIGDLFENLIFEGSSLGWDIVGTVDPIKSIEKKDFVEYRKLRYHPGNMLITIAGGVSTEEAFSLVEKYFGSMEGGTTDGGFENFRARQKSPKLKLLNKKNQQGNLIIGFLADGRGYKNRFTQSVLATLLGGAMSSRLFIEIREKRGLAYAIRTGMDRYQEVGYISTYAGVEVEKISEAIKVILDQSYGLTDGRYPIKPEELKKAKEFLKGHLALALEDSKDVNQFFGEPQLFLGKALTPEEIFERIDAVSEQEILEEAKRLFQPEKLDLAVIGPYDNEEKFKELLR